MQLVRVVRVKCAMRFLCGLFLIMTVGVGFLGASVWTEWTEYPTDPIYTPYPAATTYPCVLFDQNKFNGDGDSYYYKMWHQGPNGIALSYSNDGINWALNTSIPAGTNLVGNYFHPCVLYDKDGFGGSPYKYKIWLWDGTASQIIDAILWSVSTDGILWEQPDVAIQNALAPLVIGVPPSYFYHLYGPGFLIYNKSATSVPGQPYTFPYTMFYNTASETPSPGIIGIEQLALAYGGDGVDWTRYGNAPVLLPEGGTTVWDARYAYQPSVLKVQGVYHMYYSGSNDLTTPPTAVVYANGIGHASSFDGLTWTKDPDNPVFLYSDGVPWRAARTYTPSVITGQRGSCSVNQMWFTGAKQIGGSVKAVGYAGSVVCQGGSDFTGTVTPNTYLDRTECVLQMTWTKSSSPNILWYRIYKNGVLVGQVSASDKPYFVVCMKSCCDCVRVKIKSSTSGPYRGILTIFFSTTIGQHSIT